MTAIGPNCYFFSIYFADFEYKIVVQLENGDWEKPVLWGCDRFKSLVSGPLGGKLMKALRKKRTENELQILLSKFVYAFAPVPIPADLIISELQAIGWNRVSSLAPDLSSFKLKLSETDVIIHISDGLVEVKSLDLKIAGKKGFLLDIQKIIQKRERLASCFAQLDAQFMTLNPSRGTSEFERSIFAGRNRNPIAVTFQNSQFIADLFMTDSFIDLQIFLSNQITGPTSSDFDCGICYSDYLDGALTDFTCPNPACQHNYHRSCLLTWFRSNPACQCHFDYYSGTCLFCDSVSSLQQNIIY